MWKFKKYEELIEDICDMSSKCGKNCESGIAAKKDTTITIKV